MELRGRSVSEALALDALARARWENRLAELGTVAVHLGLEHYALDAESFAQLLQCLVEELQIETESLARGAVHLVEAEGFVGCTNRAVALCGLYDGGFPLHDSESFALGALEREALAKRGVYVPYGSRQREDETGMFLALLATATERVCLTAAVHALDGRVLPVSPFFLDARRALGTVPTLLRHDPLARSGWVPPRGHERCLRAWTVEESALQAPRAFEPALQSVRVRVDIERERQAWFAGKRKDPGPYSGSIAHDLGAMEVLKLARFASVHRPLAVTSLERAARCGFKAFAREILKLQARQEVLVTLDSKDRGHLLHALVEAGQLSLRSTVALARGPRVARLAVALDEAAEAFGQKVPHADKALLRAGDAISIRRRVESWLQARMDTDGIWQVLETEVGFGPDERWPGVELPVEAGETIVLRGRIDGVERMDDVIRAVEFKSGRGEGFRKRLREGALETQFQLVVYAVALARAAQDGALGDYGENPARVVLDGLYVGFRDHGEHGLREAFTKKKSDREAPRLEVDTLLSEGLQGRGPLAKAVHLAVLPLRAGHFAARPRDCEFCDAASLCRVERNTVLEQSQEAQQRGERTV